MTARRWKMGVLGVTVAASLVPAACSVGSSPPVSGKAPNTSPGQPNPPAGQISSSPDAPSASPDPSPSPSPSPSVQKPVSALSKIKESCPSVLSWDDFHRSNRSLHRDRLPTGQRYYASGPDAQRIVHDRYVSAVLPQTPDLLYVWLHRAPATLAARFVFTQGGTPGQIAVIGVAPRHSVIGHRHMLGFGIGSVQLAIHPEYWDLFYLVDNNNKLSYITVGTGHFRRPLRQDGKMVYRMTMTIRPKSSSVSITVPGSHATYQNAAFNELWGRLYGVQVRRPHSTDGSAQFLTAGSSASPCSASALLGRLNKGR
ncbi:MAG: hypothetical protein J2P23_13625 [Microlunatus sp.]|nr:hypothetical protein [Microlunatus sp.]